MTVNTNLYVKPGQLKPLNLPKPQQQRLLSFVRGLQRLEGKLFAMLNYAYFSRGQREICQIGAFVLARVMSRRFNLPISRTLDKNVDHIEIAVGIFCPPDMKMAEHQTYLKVYLAGKVLYVDPTYSYLFEKGFHLMVREYPAERFDQELMREFKLDRYRPDHPAYEQSVKLSAIFGLLNERTSFIEQSLAVLHAPKLVRAGEGYELVGFRLDEWTMVDTVLKALEPRAALPSLENELTEVVERYGMGPLLLMMPDRLFPDDDK